MSFRIIKGDLIKLADEDYFDVILHGCNCFCTMGAGVAKSIRRRFPIAWVVDQRTVSGNKAKLGTYTFAEGITESGQLIRVINAYTQYDYGHKKVYCDYTAIKKVLSEISNNHTGRIGMPKIGCGLAGGNWAIVEKIILDVMSKSDVTVVDFEHTKF